MLSVFVRLYFFNKIYVADKKKGDTDVQHGIRTNNNQQKHTFCHLWVRTSEYKKQNKTKQNVSTIAYCVWSMPIANSSSVHQFLWLTLERSPSYASLPLTRHEEIPYNHTQTVFSIGSVTSVVIILTTWIYMCIYTCVYIYLYAYTYTYMLLGLES